MEAFEWGTFVSDSHDGTQVVTQVRNAPRWHAEVESVISQRKAAAYSVALAGSGEQWAMPVWAEAERVTVAAAAATVPVSVGHYHDDGLALIWQSSAQWQLLEIDGAAGSSLALLDPVEDAYDNALLMPVRVGHLVQATEVGQNAAITWLRLHFTADDNRVLASTAPSQYLGDDLYLDCPLLIGDYVQDELLRPQQVLDSYTGLVSYDAPWPCARRQRTFQRFMADGSERMDMLAWLSRRIGRYRPFWMPSWTRDLTLVSTGALTTSITVVNDGYTSCREHLAVRTTSGDWLPRAITNAAEVDGNLVLTLGSSLGIDAAAVDLISYLGYHRLAADRIEFESIGGGRSFVRLPVLEVAP